MILDALNQLSKKGVQLNVVDGRLSYKAPKGALSADDLAFIKQHKAEILTLLQGHLQAEASTQIKPCPQGIDLPMSFGQQRLWFLDQLHGANPSYNMPSSLVINGALDVELLNQAMIKVIERQQILRTVYFERDGNGYQRVLSPFEFKIVEEHHPVSIQDSDTLDALLSREMTAVFDLSKDMMIRAKVMHLLDDKHLLVFTMHHIAADGWSSDLLINEVCSIYQGLTHNQAPQLPTLQYQYCDYAYWERGHFDEQRLSDLKQSWQQQLADLPQVHNFPTDKPRPSTSSFAGKVYNHRIAGATVEALERIGAKYNATQYMSMYAAFNILLKKYSGESTIVTGTPVANREQHELAGLIGFFVNTVVVKLDIDDTQTFEQVLEQQREVLLWSMKHKGLPFEELVEELSPVRHLSHHPLFQILFAFHESEKQEMSVAALDVENYASQQHFSKFDLSLHMGRDGDQWLTAWEYCTDLFDEATIVQLAEHFELLLQKLGEAPQQSLSQISLITDKQQQEILKVLGKNVVDYPSDKTYLDLFAEQAQRTPDVIAVEFENEKISYRGLDNCANQMAKHLMDKGIGSGDCVGISVERSIALIVSILAIGKTGGTYVPLDPSYPSNRITYMIKDSKINIIVKSAEVELTKPDYVEEIYPEPLLEMYREVENEHFEFAKVDIAPKDLAYIIYTSGSTGNPKGIAMHHQPLVNLMATREDQFKFIGQASRTMQFCSLNFDVSFLEICMALLNGGTLVIPDDKVRRDIPLLIEYCEQYDIETAFLPTAVLRVFIQVANQMEATLPRLKSLVTGGEQLKIHKEERVFFKRQGDCDLYNIYGPSETHMCTALRLTGDVDDWPQWPSLGTQIPNTALYIMDEERNLQPIGVPGELYIEGDCVATCYFNNQLLTDRAFLEDVKTPDGLKRLYRSGDIVRLTHEGTLDFVSRKDFQVKINGVRTELGEIESALSTHENITDTMVLLEGDKLVAFVGCKTYDADTVTNFEKEVKAFAKSVLPSGVVPSIVVALETLPLTPNGKIDRAALPKLDQLKPKEYVSPRNATERQLLAVWQDLLKLNQICVNDDFFDIGGHSLLASRLLAQIRQDFEVNVSLKDLFDSPSIRLLSILIETSLGDDSTAKLPKLVPIDRTERLALSYSQQQQWLIAKIEGETQQYSMPVILILTGGLDIDALQMTINFIYQRHEIFRTTYHMADGEAYQQVEPYQQNPLKIDDLSALNDADKEARIDAIVDSFARQGFDLAKDLMLKIQLIKKADRDYVMLLNMHHIAVDGWSIGLLTEDVRVFYNEIVAGNIVNPGKLDIQYADYASWQREMFSPQKLESELAFWREYLTDMPVLHQLTLDHPRPVELQHEGGAYAHIIEGELFEDLRALMGTTKVTLFMLTHAAFVLLMHKYTKETDIVLGSPVANRSHPALDPVIGYFVNTVTLRAQFDKDMTFPELLEVCKDSLLDVFAHQDFPFELLVEKLQPERGHNFHPMFQIMFAVHNHEGGKFLLQDVEVDAKEQPTTHAKFDLGIDVVEMTDSLYVTWEYCSELFDRETVVQMAGHYKQLLQNIIESPKLKLIDYSLQSEAERKQQLPWSPPPAAPSESMAIHQLFEAQALANPEKTAIVYKGKALSYGVLNEQANQLANVIRDRGVATNSLVGLCLDKGFELLTAVMGILKAGCAYLPLDPQYPKTRLDYMIKDSGLSLVVSDSVCATMSQLQCECLLVDDVQTKKLLAQASTNNIDVQSIGLGFNDLAYVIYTSGSTGNPKGVEISHHNVVNFYHSIQQHYKVSSADKVLQFATINFDTSVEEIFVPLCSGAQLVVAPTDMSLETQNVWDFLHQHQVNVIRFPSAYWQLLCDKLDDAIAQKVGQQIRLCLLGGEVYSTRAVQKWSQTFADHQVVLLNTYGPTESTVTATVSRLDNCPDKWTKQCIGKPMAGTECYILDESHHLLPKGIPGELYLGGAQVALGYLNKPQITDAAFMNVEIAGQTKRLYKTGDKARYGQDDNIEYLGRVDRQVKLRGFRIEPAEIEAQLMSLDKVTAVYVLLAGDDEKQLVGCVELAAGTELSEVQSELSDVLPLYMMPRLVAYETLPILPNGKIDRQQLNQTVFAQNSEREQIAARYWVEQQVVDVWEKMTKQQVSVTDNFFELGGHSLLAIQLIETLNTQLELQMSVKTLFQSDHLEDFAMVVTQEYVQTLEDEEQFMNSIDGMPEQMMEQLLSNMND